MCFCLFCMVLGPHGLVERPSPAQQWGRCSCRRLGRLLWLRAHKGRCHGVVCPCGGSALVQGSQWTVPWGRFGRRHLCRSADTRPDHSTTARTRPKSPRVISLRGLPRAPRNENPPKKKSLSLKLFILRGFASRALSWALPEAGYPKSQKLELQSLDFGRVWLPGCPGH